MPVIVRAGWHWVFLTPALLCLPLLALVPTLRLAPASSSRPSLPLREVRREEAVDALYRSLPPVSFGPLYRWDIEHKDKRGKWKLAASLTEFKSSFAKKWNEFYRGRGYRAHCLGLFEPDAEQKSRAATCSTCTLASAMRVCDVCRFQKPIPVSLVVEVSTTSSVAR